MSITSNNNLDYNNNRRSNVDWSSSSSINRPLMSVSSSASSIYSDNSQQGFQPPLDNSQQCYCPPSVKGGSQCDPSFIAPRGSSSKVAAPHQHSEFKATFYNPFETKHRRRTSRSQFKILEAVFEDNPKPSAARRQSLAEELAMTPRGVQIWFQNRRAKAKQMNDDSQRPDRPRQRSGSGSLDSSKSSSAAIGQPLYTEWDSQDPLNVTKDDGDDCQHMTIPLSPLACINSSSSNKSISSGSNKSNSGMTGIHPESRAQATQTYYTATNTSYYTDQPCLSSSSSPVDPGFELPATPTTALSPNIYMITTADQQIYKPAVTTVVYSATDDLYNDCGFIDEGNPFFPIAMTPSYGYQQHAHVSDWVKAPPTLTQPLLWPSMPHRNNHQDTTSLVPWVTLDSHHNHYQISVPSTTAIFPSPAHSSALHGVATTTAADNKDNFVDLAHVNAATLGGYSGTNHRPPTSSLEPPLDPANWEQMLPW